MHKILFAVSEITGFIILLARLQIRTVRCTYVTGNVNIPSNQIFFSDDYPIHVDSNEKKTKYVTCTVFTNGYSTLFGLRPGAI